MSPRNALKNTTPNESDKAYLAACQHARTGKRVVLKLGTQVLMDAQNRLASARLHQIVAHTAQWTEQGKEVILVTSGAVGVGKAKIQQKAAESASLKKPTTLPQKQAYAAIGQGLLMKYYQDYFTDKGILTAQVLLTAEDFADRERYLNLQKTLETLLTMGVVPIINENDTIATHELEENSQTHSFGDNDMLSALVASHLGADVLVLLTNVDGLYTDNPNTNPEATVIPWVPDLNAIHKNSVKGQSQLGRGGMASKIEAARVASLSGVHTLILNGFKEQQLPLLFDEETSTLPGTLIPGQQAKLPKGKKRWIGFASGYQGVLVVNECAKKPLQIDHASLLPIGITQVMGRFQAGDVVSIQDSDGHELGRGIAQFDHDKIRKLQGQPSPDGVPSAKQVIIHRDNLVIFDELKTG